jgi:hypothetical protein
MNSRPVSCNRNPKSKTERVVAVWLLLPKGDGLKTRKKEKKKKSQIPDLKKKHKAVVA